MQKQIALFALVVILGVTAVLYPVIAPTLQPPTPTPWRTKAAIAEQTATAEARRHATPTPRALTTFPGGRGVNCRLAPGETWTPIRYMVHDDGQVYVLARTASDCYGWMVDPD